MDRSSRNRSRRTGHRGRKGPKVPIRTYRWEDIKRARRKGGYPWTHLYKVPYTEEMDPEEYTMDAYRRSKSSSPMGRRSDRVDISEVSSWADYSGKTTPILLQELISEPGENISTKNSQPSSVIIEEYLDGDDKDLEDDVQVKEFQTESSSSSGNISQYLEKEKPEEEIKILSQSCNKDRHTRAKSEETATRKRTISGGSSHSRCSLSRLGVIKKLRDSKHKIKVPKFSFRTKKIIGKKSSAPKVMETNKEIKKDRIMDSTRFKKSDKPLYIHIPLKPPPGETDEFSHLEFEPKQENTKETNFAEKVLGSSSEEGNNSGKEQKDEINEASKQKVKDIAVTEECSEKSPFSVLEKGSKVTKKTPLKINPAFKQLLKDVRELKDKELITDTPDEKSIVEDFRLKEDSSLREFKPKIVEAQKKEIVEKEISLDLEEEHMSESESPKGDIFDKLFESSAAKKEEPTSSIPRNGRSKSAEPQNKRRSSMDSSYSWKSMSKLVIAKKIKDASEKIKKALSMDNFRTLVSKSRKSGKEEEKLDTPEKAKITKSDQMKKPKQVEPKYIHIPLKPPEGQTDEFSHLAERPLEIEPLAKKETRTDSLDSTISVNSPPSTKTDGIHFIFLTPPSDDEILDEKEDLPETPCSSSDDMAMFGTLKKLAQDVVDRVSPETKRKTLEAVREESGSDKSSSNEVEAVPLKEVENIVEETFVQDTKTNEPEEKMVVDVEDGLNETPKTEEQIKSALKTTDASSPVKRVSFKRKLKNIKEKDKEKDSGYETIETPKSDKSGSSLECIETAQQENIEEREEVTQENIITLKERHNLHEKLDDRKDITNMHQEDKDNGDHEYEPIHPPDEMTLITSSVLPNATVVDGDTGPKLVISAREILDKPVDEKKKPFFQFGRFQKDKVQVGNQDRGSVSSEMQSKFSLGKDIQEAEEETKQNEGPSRFQVVLKHRTDQLKTKTNELRNKIHNIKRPHINMPKTPEFKKPHFKKLDLKRFKIEKPKINFHLPKLPDTATIHLPHISLPGAQKTNETRTYETRQYSTESNPDESVPNVSRHRFDLSFSGTFPRFRRTKKTEQKVAFGTVPRSKEESEKKKTTAANSDNSSIRVPLHSEDSVDAADRLRLEEDSELERTGYEYRERSVDIVRTYGQKYSGDIAVEDEYERENQAINRAEYLSRWQHGNFKQRKDDEMNEDEHIIGQLVQERFGRNVQGFEKYEEQEVIEDRLKRDEKIPRYVEEDEKEDFDISLSKNKHMVTDLDNLEDDPTGPGYSSEGSGFLREKGILGKLDVDSDEFFVVHEIREGFQTPANALAQMNEYDPIGSNRSLPSLMREREQPIKGERKSIKKPKRKKTPHVSHEEIRDDEESIEGDLAPSRPKRRSKRNRKKSEKDEHAVAYQDTNPLETHGFHGQRLEFPRESLGILGDDERDEYELEKDKNREIQRKNIFPDPYEQFQDIEQKLRHKEEDLSWSAGKQDDPSAPPRKHRSLKSLTQSENESLLSDNRYDNDRYLNIVQDQMIQTQGVAAPRRPNRRSHSNTSSLSRMSLAPSQRDTDSTFTDEGYLAENQLIPTYLIENQNYKKQQKETEGSVSYKQRQPCIEEPCVQDIRDHMGYAIVDKTKQRDPPLPPPRTPTRRRKREIKLEEKFATVPRNIGIASQSQSPPIRPLRNYSTLSHIQSNRKNVSSLYVNDGENKENQNDTVENEETEDEINRDLVSGEVVQKMRERPLPAPPRPPRKSKTTRRSLQDITSKENNVPVPSDLKEETVSTQTEPLPADFICEEVKREPTDTIITPRVNDSQVEVNKSDISEHDHSQIERFQMFDPRTPEPKSEREVKREFITPSVYSFEETVTHGTLLVQPINGAKIVSDHQLCRERLVPISKACSDEDDESSEIPDSFRQLKSPKEEILTTNKIQVAELDVDRLTVNELLASKLVVSEIESSNITTNEVEGKGGPIKFGDIQLPPEFLERLVTKMELHRTSGLDPEASAKEQGPLDGQKKTSIFEIPLQLTLDSSRNPVPPDTSSQLVPEIPQCSPPFDTRGSSVESSEGFDQPRISSAPPEPPPRGCTLEGAPPDAPPRSLRRKSKADSPTSQTTDDLITTKEAEQTFPIPLGSEMLEPEVDYQPPPPRPPQPLESLYMPSQPPASFYALRAKQFVEENIPTAPRRKRHHRSRPVSRSRSTSEDSSTAPLRPRRMSRRSSEPSIPELSGHLIQACGSRINNTLKRLIFYLRENVVRNADGNQDLHVFMFILLVLIAGLILLGYGEDRTVIHLHHWEYFNPPKDL